MLQAFKAWLDEQAPQVLPESLLGKAIAYTRNQWNYLSRYVVEGRAPIDNNVIERDIRPISDLLPFNFGPRQAATPPRPE